MNDKIRLKIILGSTREGRLSEIPGRWIAQTAARRPETEVELLDLRDFPMPFFNEPALPSIKKEPYAEPAVARWTAKIAEADAFIIIAPEYNHAPPAVLKNALDWAYQEWNRKPVAFVAYGSALGARSVEQLRQIAVELQMAPIRSALHLPPEITAAMWAGKVTDDSFKPLEDRARSMLEDLLWWTRALKKAREEK